MSTILQDLRYGLRMLGQRPGFTAVAALALALGIGANTAIFSVVHTVVLRPLPYPEPERIVTVWDDNSRQGWPKDVTGFSTFADWKSGTDAFEQMAALSRWSANLTGDGDPERLAGARVSTSYFDVLGVRPALGRAFADGEDREGTDAVAVLSHGLWQRRFGGDAGVLGKSVSLNDVTVTVVGVLPPGVEYPLQTEIWVPLRTPAEPDRGNHYLHVLGRLRPGVSLQAADAQLDGVMARLAKEYPQQYEGFAANVVGLHEHLVGDVRPALLVLLGAVLFVLLIACANVANLLLARTAAREREIAVRTALGAGRSRIVRQLLTESVLLGLLGGVLGLLLAVWGAELLVGLAPGGVPRLDALGFDPAVLAFTLGVSLLTGALFGLAPALQVSRPDLVESLKEARSIGSGTRGRRTRAALVVAEVGLALVLLVGAGLLLQSFSRLREVEPGFRPERLLTFNVQLPRARYAEPEKSRALFDSLVERLAALPGAEGAAVVMSLPMGQGYSSAGFSIEGRPQPPVTQQAEAKYNIVSQEYFRVLGVELVRGRAFTSADHAEAPRVLLVSEGMARRFFPDEDPLGKRFKWGQPEEQDSPWREIVGIVADVRHHGLETEPDPEVYMPLAQEPIGSASIVVRTAAAPEALAAASREVLGSLDAALPLYGLRSMEQVLESSLAQRRFSLSLLGLFSAVALLLATLGIYGVTSYMVGQRTREIGIRMALGASRTDVLRLVLGQGFVLVLAGIGLGLLAAGAMSRLLGGLLYGISQIDPLTYGAVAALLAAVALLACYVPARRATRVDPMVALRHE